MPTPQPMRRSTAPDRGTDQLRLLLKVARLYHEQNVLQPEIAHRLHISQARVSRLLKQAQAEGIVRTTVVAPEGMQTHLEEALESAYGLREAVVVDCFDDSEQSIVRDLGVATASYLEASLTGGDVVGISSWSATLLAAVDAMRRLPRVAADRVAAAHRRGRQPGGRAACGAPHATLRRADGREADLPPGAGDRAVRAGAQGAAAGPVRQGGDGGARRRQPRARGHRRAGAVAACSRAAATSTPSGSSRALGERGAVGDVCLRFFDADGKPVSTDVDKRVIGVTLQQLTSAERSVGVAGGERKYDAIRGAVRGGWINVLITDVATAERLVADAATA